MQAWPIWAHVLGWSGKYCWYIPFFSLFSSRSLVAKLCPTLCNPIDCSPSGSSVHGVLQAGILEWVAISFSRRSSPPRNRHWVSCIAAASLTTEPRGKPFPVMCKQQRGPRAEGRGKVTERFYRLRPRGGHQLLGAQRCPLSPATACSVALCPRPRGRSSLLPDLLQLLLRGCG